MTDSVPSSSAQKPPSDQRIAPPAAIASLDRTIDCLRQLTQISVQSQWRACWADLTIAEATQPERWSTWPIAALNPRQHVAWARGQQGLWLAQAITVPTQQQGYPLAGFQLRLALTWWAETAQVFVNGQLVQEGDLFDHSARILLNEAVQPGQVIPVALRLVSPGHDDGALVRSLLQYERPAAICPEPGFVADELAVLQTYLTALRPEGLPELAAAIEEINWSALDGTAPEVSLPDSDLPDSDLPDPDRPDPEPTDPTNSHSIQANPFDRSLIRLRQRLLPWSDWIKPYQIHLLGHAHLDLAWLWPIAETWEVAERTFRSVLQLQQEYPDLQFCHSTPALYAWIEEHRPDVWAAIQAKVATGRWEIAAGLWVEPELNLVSGESIARQILYGQRYVQQRFGHLSRIAWLPDTFGFCWQLPQLLQQGGIEYFVTQKLRWNDCTEFPYDWFQWQAPDGSTVFSWHSGAIGEGIDPVKMAQYASSWHQKTHQPIALWLFGVGDHGGGPTRDMLQVAQRWQRSPFFPQLAFSTAVEFLDQIRDRSVLKVSAQNQSGQDPAAQDKLAQSTSSQSTLFQGPDSQNQSLQLLPVQESSVRSQFAIPHWQTELYLEFHRGCYTSHADQKQLNRACERGLYEAELYASIATLLTHTPYPKFELETAWKQVLFNQFHDILPGSAIAAVYAEVNPLWQSALSTAHAIRDAAVDLIAAQIAFPPPPVPDAIAIVVFNSLSWERSHLVTVLLSDSRAWSVLDLEGQPVFTAVDPSTSPASLQVWADRIPAIGYRGFWLVPADSVAIASSEDALTDSAGESCSESEYQRINPHSGSQNRGLDRALDPSSSEFVLENQWLRVTIDPETGNIASLWDRQQSRSLFSAPANQLQAFRDEGQYWDAWNIDPAYAEHPLPDPVLVRIHYDPCTPLETRIRVDRQIGHSLITQRYRLPFHSPVLEIETEVDWQERHVLLKAAFPFAGSADCATYDMPYGVIQRPTRPQTDRDRAQWEVPALTWADLSTEEASGYGFSLLSDYKHGYDAQPDRLRLTLLRGSEWPDPEADRGWHRFRYGIYPHAGSWKAADTLRRSYEFNHPLSVNRVASSAIQASLPPIGSFLTLPVSNGIVTAVKQSENESDTWIIRGYECQGESACFDWRDGIGILQAHLDLTDIRSVDGLERVIQPESDVASEPMAGLHPWAIASWRVRQVHRAPEHPQSSPGAIDSILPLNGNKTG